MALKKKLSKAEYDKLSDAIKAEYIEDGDGFRLDIDGDEDTPIREPGLGHSRSFAERRLAYSLPRS